MGAEERARAKLRNSASYGFGMGLLAAAMTIAMLAMREWIGALIFLGCAAGFGMMGYRARRRLSDPRRFEVFEDDE